MRLVGGPFDGRDVESSRGEYRVPVRQPVTVVRRDRRRRSMLRAPDEVKPVVEFETYHRVGPVYAWDGLVDDAWCDGFVTEQVIAVGRGEVLRAVRVGMLRELEELAAGKDLGRIVWRLIAPTPADGVWTVRAYVGPRAPMYGLGVRVARR